MSSLFGDFNANAPTLTEIAVDTISPDPNQPRKHFDQEAIKELASTVKEQGLIQPIVVRSNPDGDGYLIVAGERRFRAVQRLEWKKVPVIVRDDLNAAVAAIIENIQRVNLSPFEEADAIAELMDEQGISQGDVANMIGWKRKSVNGLLGIRKLPKEIRGESLEMGTPKTILIELAQVKDAETVKKLWKRSKDERLTVGDIRKARQDTRSSSTSTSKTPDVATFLKSTAKNLASFDEATLSAEQKVEARAIIATLEELVDRV